MINELDLINDLGLLFNNRVIIYGAGITGIEAHNMLKEFGVPSISFCDGNQQKWENSIDGIKIISPGQLKCLDSQESIVIVICAREVQITDQIIADIRQLDLRTTLLFTLFGLKVAIFQNIYDQRINENYRTSFIHTEKLRHLIKQKRRILNTLLPLETDLHRAASENL